MESSLIYLDYAATTPVASQVLEVMLPFLSEQFGNPASTHHLFGQTAKRAVEQAREQVAALVGVDPHAVVFTSGGTESNNLAIKGIMSNKSDGHIVVSAVEHASVLDSTRRIERTGTQVSYVTPTPDGVVTPEAIEEALQPNTQFVSVMWGNNEVGSVNDIEAICALCSDRGILFHSDAAQAAGHLNVDATAVDLLTITGHKLYAPKGIGALIVKKDVQLSPQIVGGESERGRRGGTLNVPSIVGFGKACSMCDVKESESIRSVRDLFESQLFHSLDGITIHGRNVDRLPHISSIRFGGVGLDFSPATLSDIACSSGSACQSGSTEGSHVLQAMGLSTQDSASTIRFSFGRQIDNENAKNAVKRIISCVNQCRELSIM